MTFEKTSLKYQKSETQYIPSQTDMFDGYFAFVIVCQEKQYDEFNVQLNMYDSTQRSKFE